MTPTKTMTQTNSFKTSRTRNKKMVEMTMMMTTILIMRMTSNKKLGGKSRQTTKKMTKRWKLSCSK